MSYDFFRTGSRSLAVAARQVNLPPTLCRRAERKRVARVLRLNATIVVVATVMAGGTAQTSLVAADPTYTRDVAAILYHNCVSCHRRGEVAPMSLMSYDEVRPWARSIKDKILSREMPPWFADPAYGPFRNDRRLSEENIVTVSAWVDAGAPKGDDADLPSLPEFAEGWSHPDGTEPDYVIEMPVEVQIPAEGQLDILNLYQEVPFAEDTFAEALEVRPGNRAVLHHGGPYITYFPRDTHAVDGRALDSDGEPARRGERQLVAGTSKLLSYVPGRGFEQYRPGTAKRIPADAYLNWNQHYQPTGQPETDRSTLGIWVSNVEVTHEILTLVVGQPFPTESPATARWRILAEGTTVSSDVAQVIAGFGSGHGLDVPTIPPHADDYTVVSLTPVLESATLFAFSPHMHLRGKSMEWRVVYPDGSQETLFSVPTYDFNWQQHYELETPIRIPAGSVMYAVGVFDNSSRNRYNPAPHNEVYWAEQSWDEMYDPFIEVTIDRLDLSRTAR